MLQTQTVSENTLALIKRLMADPQLNDFLLVGGTALALTIGHRLSVDIDLFAFDSFDAALIANHLKSVYYAEEVKPRESSLICFIDQVKVDLITHPYPEVSPHNQIDGIRIMSLSDIAAMKLHAIVRSGSRLKDFVDICFLLEKMPLAEMYAAYEEKYSPHSRAAVARMALTDTSGVNLNDEIRLSYLSFNWEATKQRLQEALEFTQKIFPAMKQNRIRNDPPEKKRGFRM
ncbi:hypothetical protein A8C56_09565 [Niabella ginsenosidivorans]|uniref:Nucleotidyltransferase n=1 Tax=Niabella ginsenosidivorans TaxID=1176587 RepID=A0A1A9I0M3_9BACT|nr:nucleotidyl transferase AbiEii/AbiGii toxin family protein [Niabella ginsenosidivorans]ANH81198.1 hypothetical protein A8C56_09565 [Niabella ginsenosidivorans]